MAALAYGQEVTAGVVGRVMIEMGAGQAHARPRQARRPGRQGRELLQPATLCITPCAALSVPPSSVTQMGHNLSMGLPAPLPAAFGAAEAHRGRELVPIERVEAAVFGGGWAQKCRPLPSYPILDSPRKSSGRSE